MAAYVRGARRVPALSVPARRILVARGLRAVGDGCVSVVLPLHLVALGLSPLEVGILATATLVGSGMLTLLLGAYAWRFRRRTLLLTATALMAATGIAFASLSQFWPLLVVAVVGTLNPSSGDVSVFLPLEHAGLADMAADRERTTLFAQYSLVGAVCGAAGALAAGLPTLAAPHLPGGMHEATQLVFVLYALLAAGCTFAYAGLPEERHARPAAHVPVSTSRNTVYRLAALFSLDAFAGGLLVQSLLTLWLWQRFSFSAQAAGVLFFCTGLLSALSYLVAARIAGRIGLLRTMVFTHLPSSIFLVAIPFVGDVQWVIALLLARSALSQMDVPTRSSYVMAIVTPPERAAAASITTVPRSLAAAMSPACAGYLLGVSAFAWPLLMAGALKIVYDVLLLALFRGVRPPEERQGTVEGDADPERRMPGRR